MNLGDSSAWRRRLLDVHELLLERIAAVWPSCSGRFQPETQENKISDQLALALQKDPGARRFIIVPQYQLLDEDLRGDVVTKGLIDIAVFVHQNEIYLAFECKRLSVGYPAGRESLAGKYAEDGVMRYVKAQYAQRLPMGAMLGYVMDGDSEWVMERLEKALRQRSEALCLVEPPVKLSPVEFIRRFRTVHRRMGDLSLFEVRHGLLPLGPQGVSR